ncbi:MAG TPA: hypothetical protein VGL71_10060 [Urbifossiella sp.]
MMDGISKNGRAKPRYKIGEWVTYIVGGSRHACEVIQLVGPIGNTGIFYYRLREPIWYSEAQEFDFPETSLEAATPADLENRYPPEQRIVGKKVSV